MEPTKDTILTRIKKLQNLTTERGATPEEAATAAAKVQALLFEHNISTADVETHEQHDGKPDNYGKVEHELQGANRNTVQWRRSLLYVIAKHNFCTAVTHPNTTKMSVIGKRSNVEVVLYLNATLVRDIERLAVESVRTILQNKAAYMVSFCRGAVSTIQTRLHSQRHTDEMRSTMKQETGQSTALVLRKADADLNKAVASFYPRLRTTSTRSRISNSDGYSAGRAAGHHIGIRTGINGRPAARLN